MVRKQLEISLLVSLTCLLLFPSIFTVRANATTRTSTSTTTLQTSDQQVLDYKIQDQRGDQEEGGGHKDLGDEEEEINPYVFEYDRDFVSRVKTEHGRVDVLQQFTKNSNLLSALANYRVEILEANPLTFITPAHIDADFVLFVVKGRGAITVIHEEIKRETSNLECGDIFRVHADTTFYMVNRDEYEKLYVAKILFPVNLPGNYEAFYGAGGGDSESFFEAFSWDLVEAALNTERGRLEKIFKQQQGKIMNATKQQIEALSQDEEGVRGSNGAWPFPSNVSGSPFNLFKKGAIKSNNYGDLYEADPRDFKPLEYLNLIVSFASITQGSMAGPFHSKAAKIFIVVEGEGYFEMTCPHHSSSSGSSSPTYQNISSHLRRGTIFIAPASYPVAIVASNNSTLKLLCFEVNAQANIRYTLAGKGNVIDAMHIEAKELAFGVAGIEVEQIFRNQMDCFFFPGPSTRQQRQGSRADT